jgi:hypothetical protein
MLQLNRLCKQPIIEDPDASTKKCIRERIERDSQSPENFSELISVQDLHLDQLPYQAVADKTIRMRGRQVLADGLWR